MSSPDFIDECRIHVKSGDGGRGCCSFWREKYVPRGGPDGGTGGRGGSVSLVADASLATLLDTHGRKFYRADRGKHGSGGRKDGRGGEDLVVAVDEQARGLHTATVDRNSPVDQGLRPHRPR